MLYFCFIEENERVIYIRARTVHLACQIKLINGFLLLFNICVNMHECLYAVSL